MLLLLHIIPNVTNKDNITAIIEKELNITKLIRIVASYKLRSKMRLNDTFRHKY